MPQESRDRVLVVDDEPEIRALVRDALTGEGFEVAEAASGEEAVAHLLGHRFEVVLLDLSMPGKGGLATLKEIRSSDLSPEVVILTGMPGVESAVQAMKLGAYDYLTKPLELADLARIAGRAAEKVRLESENRSLRRALSQHQTMGPVISESDEMKEVLRLASQIAPSDLPVLITGETGSGKGLIAKWIHAKSLRSDRPMIPINCGALQEQIFESELFGHEKGSFTGAVKAKPGLFEVADGGTLVLDEVAELGPAMQAKLLQVLDDGVLRRVGGTALRKVDVRLLALTNKDLDQEVEAGGFRRDLFFRLNSIRIRIPTLRSRADDIRGLVRHYLKRFRRPGEPAKEITPAALEALCAYSWPGNVRELANTLETLVLLTEGSRIHAENLPANLLPAPAVASPGEVELPRSMAEIERLHILRTLEFTKGNKAAAARLLGIHVKTLSNKLKAFAGKS